MITPRNLTATYLERQLEGAVTKLLLVETSFIIPILISAGDNIYVAWTTNKTGHDEVMFRMSTDAGKTFSDKIQLSDSQTRTLLM